MTTQTAPQPTTNGDHPTVSKVKAGIAQMLAPSSKAVSRKAWGIDVSSIWLPFLTAAKVTGAVDDGDLPNDELGAPFRLRRDKDTNEVKFSNTGRPMFSVAPHINDLVNRARENYVAGLTATTRAVMDERPEAYAAQVSRQHAAGAPIVAKEQDDVDTAFQALQQAAHPDSLGADEAAAEAAAPTRRRKVA